MPEGASKMVDICYRKYPHSKLARGCYFKTLTSQNTVLRWQKSWKLIASAFLDPERCIYCMVLSFESPPEEALQKKFISIHQFPDKLLMKYALQELKIPFDHFRAFVREKYCTILWKIRMKVTCLSMFPLKQTGCCCVYYFWHQGNCFI